MARNNYQYEKRQKDIAKKKKQDEKRLKKLNRSSDTDPDNLENNMEDADNTENEDETKDEGI